MFGQESKKITYKLKSLEYKKVLDFEDVANYKKNDFPIFLFDSNNLNQIQIATNMLEYLDIQQSYLKNNSEVTKLLEAEYKNVIKAQENRVLVYKEAYDQMRTINEDLNKQIDIAIDLGRKSAKRNKVNGVLFGVLGGLVTGMTVGVIVSN